MEATFGRKAHELYSSPVVSDLKAVAKKTVEWDLNDWTWDGDLFKAAPSNSHNHHHFLSININNPNIPTNTGLSNTSSSCSDEVIIINDKGKRELEKKRRVIVVSEHEEELNNLKLGGQVYPITETEMEELEGKTGKKSKVAGGTLNRSVCQVDDCRTDLSSAKDYHRRHKVCDMHSKASRALVGKEIQRFCQQCSRFHVLQEFDEGKRSCRRRLAGHNRRRRKTHPENAVNEVPVIDEPSSSYILISLLRILSNIHSSNSDETKDQVLLSHLLKNLGNLKGAVNNTNLSALLNGHQDSQNAGTSTASLEKECRSRLYGESVVVPPPISQSAIVVFPSENGTPAVKAIDLESRVRRQKMSNFDLNNVYDDSQDCAEKQESSEIYVSVHQDSNKSSQPQTSGNSGSLSTLSPSTSSGEAQSRTDRIVFKLFGKDPTDLPLGLRNQIMEWLSNTPTEIESYIRPGCIILTIYLRMEKSMWEELYKDLNSSLRRLLDSSTDSFWKTGWIYTRVRNRVAFAYNGQVVLDTPLKNDKSCKILSIKPIAVSISDRAQFSVKGVNLSQSTTRLLCALEGKYLYQQSILDMEGIESLSEHDEEFQSLGFPCYTPNITGRGFIEVEDYSLSSSFFPFIVAEKDICTEICTLEPVLDASETESRNQALDFIHEMGWLLHKNHLKLKSGSIDNNSDLFSFKRFKWLIEFSIDHEWSAVVKKLLDILFTSTVDTGDCRSIELALQEIGLLHRAVRRNSRPMVEILLSYYPKNSIHKLDNMVIRPDAVGPGGLTPLHIVASTDGSDNILDALMDDPGLVGIEAWRSVKDSTGLTPNDYACMRGHFSYIHLVQKKINKIKSAGGHVVLDIPSTNIDPNIKPILGDAHKSSEKIVTFETEKTLTHRAVQRQCNRCEQKLVYGTATSPVKFYRPAMLSMVAIAAVCVCVALLFKSCPEVLYSFRPFRWEHLEYGWS